MPSANETKRNKIDIQVKMRNEEKGNEKNTFDIVVLCLCMYSALILVSDVKLPIDAIRNKAMKPKANSIALYERRKEKCAVRTEVMIFLRSLVVVLLDFSFCSEDLFFFCSPSHTFSIENNDGERMNEKKMAQQKKGNNRDKTVG